MSKVNSIYLAYPIDQVVDFAQDFYAMIEKFKTSAAKHVSWVFDPGDAFRVNPLRGVDPGLAVINRQALAAADAVVAFLPREVPSIGVPMEVERAHAMGKALLIFSDTASYMLKLPGVGRSTEFDDEALEEGLDWLLDQEMEEPSPAFGTTRWMGAEAFEPKRTYSDDAGYDLIVSADFVVEKDGFSDVPCGISVELPEGVWAMVTGRSSTLRKRGLLVHPGVIDTGWRGPIFAGVWNQTDENVYLRMGERIAQLVLFPNLASRYPMQRVEALTPSERGTNGFGSTGA
jgi:dUTP pyrophosphatase